MHLRIGNTLPHTRTRVTFNKKITELGTTILVIPKSCKICVASVLLFWGPYPNYVCRQTRGAGVKNFGCCFHDICASQVHGIVPKRNMAFAQASPGKALPKNREMGGGKG